MVVGEIARRSVEPARNGKTEMVHMVVRWGGSQKRRMRNGIENTDYRSWRVLGK